jgi:hypothetical protein
MRKITGAALAAVLFACSAFAHDHSALNGTWTLVPTKSEFAGQPVIQTGTVTISSEGDVIIVTRSFAYAGATENGDRLASPSTAMMPAIRLKPGTDLTCSGEGRTSPIPNARRRSTRSIASLNVLQHLGS